MPGTYREEMAMGWVSLSFFLFFFKLSTNMPCDLAEAWVFRGAHVRQIPGKRRLLHASSAWMGEIQG